MTYEELMVRAKAAKSAEELIALAKENDVEMTEESAKAYFEQLNKKASSQMMNLIMLRAADVITTINSL